MQILIGGGLVSRQDVSDCKSIARDLKIPVIQAIKTSGLIADNKIDLCQSALQKITEQQITVDLAIRAVRLANQRGMAIDHAILQAKEIHEQTKVNIFEANTLTKLLLSANVINNEQYSRTMIKVRSSSMMLGQALVVDGLISTAGLLAALDAVLVMEESKLLEADAITALRYAYKKNISFEQALFELGTFIPPDAKTIRIGEFFVMAGLITKEDLAECVEIQLFKQKQISQILHERGLASQEHLQAAVQLLTAVSHNTMKPHQAASALAKVCAQGKDIYEAMAELQTKKEEPNTRVGDMLVDAGILERAVVEEIIQNQTQEKTESAMKVGAALMRQRLIGEQILHAALRLQTSVRLGYLPRDWAIDLLRYCSNKEVDIEQAFESLNIFVPGRMQWTWV